MKEGEKRQDLDATPFLFLLTLFVLFLLSFAFFAFLRRTPFLP